jgi:mono/diheme cytochrome c family protein
MWLILFFMAWAQTPPAAPASSALDFATYKAKVEPLFLEKRPGHARCVVCHSTGTNFRLQALSPGQKAWTGEQSQKNFEMVSRFVLPGVPMKSRLLVMPLSHEAGGVEFHPGGKHWESQDDPEWKTLADWVKGGK